MQKILGVLSVLLCMGLLVGYYVNEGMWDDRMEKAAMQSYYSGESFTTLIRGVDSQIQYDTDAYAVIVTVEVSNGRTYQKIELNKSRIVGEYAGKRIKQFGSGLWNGIKEKSKFTEK